MSPASATPPRAGSSTRVCCSKAGRCVNPFVNRWLWASIALAGLLQVAVVHVGRLNTAFGTVPLALDQWALCVAMASGVLWASKVRKLVGWAVG